MAFVIFIGSVFLFLICADCVALAGRTDRPAEDYGVQDRRNIAAAYIGSLTDTESNRKAIARLKNAS